MIHIFWVICFHFFQDACLLGSLEDGLNALLNIEVSMLKKIIIQVRESLIYCIIMVEFNTSCLISIDQKSCQSQSFA